MKFIKKTALTLFMAIFLGANATMAFAVEVPKSSAESLSDTIAHIDKAIVAVNKSNFAASNLHIKAARASSELITGNDAIVKEANEDVIQGQIESKQGNVKKSIAQLTKGLELYKSL